jgi:hypothetical protein
MEPNEPNEPNPQAAGDEGSGATRDALRQLEERLDRASEAAERLIAEAAAASAASAGRVAGSAARAAGSAARAAGSAGSSPPPAGWQEPSSEAGAGGGDLELLAQVVQSLRELIPSELQHRLAEALRELLLAVRALIDWYLERIEQRHAEPAEVQDIPIL